MVLQDSADQSQISLAYLPPTPRQTRSALAAAAVLLLGLAALAPFAAKPLPRVIGFIPALDATIFVTDVITAGLLFAHFSITRSRALLALACGYLFTALIVVAHGVTFPVEFSPTEDLSRTLRINWRFYLFWHLGLPVTVFFYVWLRVKDRKKGGVGTPTALVAICSVAGVLALVSCLAWFAAAGDELLPLPLSGLDRSSPLANAVGSLPRPQRSSAPLLYVLTMLICTAALPVLWAFRRSVLDQWLMVVTLASMAEPILALFGGRLFALGFYAGRAFWLVASTFVLVALLAETTRLYARLCQATLLARAVKAEAELAHANRVATMGQLAKRSQL